MACYIHMEEAGHTPGVENIKNHQIGASGKRCCTPLALGFRLVVVVYYRFEIPSFHSFNKKNER